jgi:hypothetical protein
VALMLVTVLIGRVNSRLPSLAAATLVRFHRLPRLVRGGCGLAVEFGVQGGLLCVLPSARPLT